MLASKYSSGFFGNATWKQFNDLNYNTGFNIWKQNHSVSKKGETFDNDVYAHNVLSDLYQTEDPCNFLYEKYWENVFQKDKS